MTLCRFSWLGQDELNLSLLSSSLSLLAVAAKIHNYFSLLHCSVGPEQTEPCSKGRTAFLENVNSPFFFLIGIAIMRRYVMGLKSSRTSAKCVYSNRNYFWDFDNTADKIIEGNQISLQGDLGKWVPHWFVQNIGQQQSRIGMWHVCIYGHAVRKIPCLALSSFSLSRSCCFHAGSCQRH